MNDKQNKYSDLSDAVKNALLGNLAHAGALDAARELLEAGADPNRSKININAARPLQSAFRNGDAAMVKLLLEHGADPSANFYLSQIDDCMIESKNYRELITLVLEYQQDKDLTSRAINGCAKNGDNEFLEYLLTKEWTYQQTDKAMGHASSRGHTDIVETLRKQEFIISVSDIVNATCNGHLETAKKLLSLIEFEQDQLDNAMLNTYRRTHDYDKTEVFLNAGADPHAQQDKLLELCKNNGDTAFMDRLIVEKHFKPIPKQESFGWPDPETDFDKHINETMRKADLHEKLNQKLQPRQAQTSKKAKGFTMKI